MVTKLDKTGVRLRFAAEMLPNLIDPAVRPMKCDKAAQPQRPLR